MSKKITMKGLYGLGITSVTDFFKLMTKYQLVRDVGVAYINANRLTYDKKSGLIIFDGLREYFRFADSIREHQVIVISDIPTILKEITDLTPLDFDMQRSFEFNFTPIDTKPVIRSIASKTARVTTTFTGYNNLGYHVERVKNTSDIMAAFIGLTTLLNFDLRNRLRRHLNAFFQEKKCNLKPVIACVQQFIADNRDSKLKDEATTFITRFEEQGESYYKAVRATGQSKAIAKQYGVDPYAINYFRRMQNQLQIVDERNKKSNVTVLS